MKRILFVEDSELLREVFEISLSAERGQWDVKTAASGEAALELLKQSAFDVIASDMGMPGMDGIELLKRVGILYPHTSRIIISGRGDQGSIAEALGSTHQFLVKPVDVKTLRATLSRITALDAYLKDEKLKALAARLRSLPSFPALYLEMVEAVESPDSSLQDIADIVTKDPGITAKMLQVANSAAHGSGERISDPLDAIQQLGMHTVRSLVLSAHVYGSFPASKKVHFSVDALWSHLMRTGEIARGIMECEESSPSEIEDAYTAAILHDIGKLMLAESLPGEFQQAIDQAAKRGVPFHQVEMEMFGATHAGLAAYLLGLWGLSASVVEAVAFHHNPELSAESEFTPLTAVHVANALAYKENPDSRLNMDYLAKIGAVEQLDFWRNEAESVAAKNSI